VPISAIPAGRPFPVAATRNVRFRTWRTKPATYRTCSAPTPGENANVESICYECITATKNMVLPMAPGFTYPLLGETRKGVVAEAAPSKQCHYVTEFLADFSMGKKRCDETQALQCRANWGGVETGRSGHAGGRDDSSFAHLGVDLLSQEESVCRAADSSCAAAQASSGRECPQAGREVYAVLTLLTRPL
jgi:hypothetical protein